MDNEKNTAKDMRNAGIAALENMLNDGILTAEVFDKLAAGEVNIAELDLHKKTHYFMVSGFNDKGHYKYLVADVTGSTDPTDADYLEFHAKLYGKKGHIVAFSSKKQARNCTRLLKDQMLSIAEQSGKVEDVDLKYPNRADGKWYGLISMNITGYQREKIIKDVNEQLVEHDNTLSDIVSLQVPESVN